MVVMMVVAAVLLLFICRRALARVERRRRRAVMAMMVTVAPVLAVKAVGRMLMVMTGTVVSVVEVRRRILTLKRQNRDGVSEIVDMINSSRGDRLAGSEVKRVGHSMLCFCTPDVRCRLACRIDRATHGNDQASLEKSLLSQMPTC